MQHPWWFPMKDVAKHTFVYSVILMLFAIAAIFESMITSVAEHLIRSKFTFQVLVCLEYAVVVGDAVLIVILIVENIWHSLKRSLK